jgi:diacylglycerol O-acyltransferase
MSGTDASFLYFETPSTHMHVLGTIVVSTKDRPGWSADDVIALLERRLDLLPAFRRKLASATLRLHHPVWVDVPHVDVAEHVSRVHCPAPGTREQLAHEVASFAGRQLDRSRPLWECLVVEGLGPDGRSEAELRGARAEARAAQQPEPGVLDVALHTVTGLALRPLRVARLLPTTVRAVAGLVSHRRSAADGALPLNAPRAPFNGAITPGRVVAYVDISLADVKAIKRAVGGTFNDAVLGICGGAFRSYLDKRGELPVASLIAVVPVSVRGGAEDDAANRVSAMFTSLATDVADPLERLKAVQQANEVAKGDQEAMGDELVMRFGELAPPNTTAAIARFYSALRLADRHPVVHNVVVSNVAGPPVPIYLAGVLVEGLYPLGPVLEGPGLNITIVSYHDHVGVGLIACSDRMPDLADLAAEFPRAVQQTLAAIAG